MNHQPLSDDERLTRYILRKEFIRRDGTLKPDPFIPFRHTELSVTRLSGLTDARIWEIGESVAKRQTKTLHGRGDAHTVVYTKEKLYVYPAPVEENPNHANVTGWPAEKDMQKAIALEIVKSIQYIAK